MNNEMILYYKDKPVAYLIDAEGFKEFINDYDASKVIKVVDNRRKHKQIDDFKGVFNEYSKKGKKKDEKEAWKKHVEEKHAR